MSNDLSSLSEDHIRQLGRIVETLERSTFDFLQLEVGDLKVTVGKGNVPLAPAPSPAPAPAPSTVGGPSEPPVVSPPPGADAPAPDPIAEDANAIASPIMGMFYAQPEPGAPPFVNVGTVVDEDTTVGLIEVMKTFNAVKAGVRGRIVELCIPDVQLVEYGQVLFRVTAE